MKQINRVKSIFYLSILFSFLAFAHVSAEIDQTDDEEAVVAYRNISALSGNPAANDDIQNRFLELRKQSAEESADENRFISRSPLYLIKREEDPVNPTDQNIDISKEVFAQIKSQRTKKVNFDKNTIVPFDGRGTCSAMALDFITRFINECGNINDRNGFRTCVRKFKPYYRVNLTTYNSRQAAYNTITVDHKVGVEKPNIIKRQKIQSLANYHNLKLKPATQSIKITEIDSNPKKFKKLINDLPYGNYVIRALSPKDNHKMESYGHTMIFIKGKKFSAYYDNRDGVVDITDEVNDYVTDKLLSWYIPEVRIYHAEKIPNTPSNLSTERYGE